jgi:hypothetical protein
MRVGLIAAAATAGVLVGLGLRHGAALTPFVLYGRAVLASVTGLLAPPALATVIGFIGHAFWMLLWGVCFSVVAAPLRAPQLALAAAMFATILGLLSATLLPSALGAGAMASLSGIQTAFFLFLMAGALYLGMRLARQ